MLGSDVPTTPPRLGGSPDNGSTGVGAAPGDPLPQAETSARQQYGMPGPSPRIALATSAATSAPDMHSQYKAGVAPEHTAVDHALSPAHAPYAAHADVATVHDMSSAAADRQAAEHAEGTASSPGGAAPSVPSEQVAAPDTQHSAVTGAAQTAMPAQTSPAAEPYVEVPSAYDDNGAAAHTQALAQQSADAGADHLSQPVQPAQYAPAPQPGIMPNPYEHYAYDDWSDEVWNQLYALDEGEAYWYHFMLAKAASFSSEQWAQFQEENPELYDYMQQSSERWQQQPPGAELYTGAEFAPVQAGGGHTAGDAEPLASSDWGAHQAQYLQGEYSQPHEQADAAYAKEQAWHAGDAEAVWDQQDTSIAAEFAAYTQGMAYQDQPEFQQLQADAAANGAYVHGTDASAAAHLRGSAHHESAADGGMDAGHAALYTPAAPHSPSVADHADVAQAGWQAHVEAANGVTEDDPFAFPDMPMAAASGASAQEDFDTAFDEPQELPAHLREWQEHIKLAGQKILQESYVIDTSSESEVCTAALEPSCADGASLLEYDHTPRVCIHVCVSFDK